MKKNSEESLRAYVTSAAPSVNEALRNNQIEAVQGELDALDQCFTPIPDAKTLYRFMPASAVKPDSQNQIMDKGYQSCSDDMDLLFDHFSSDDLACLVITCPQGQLAIDVTACLPEGNNEGEFILPRGIRLQVEQTETYLPEDFSHFAEVFDLNVSARELKESYRICSITTYRCTPIA